MNILDNIIIKPRPIPSSQNRKEGREPVVIITKRKMVPTTQITREITDKQLEILIKASSSLNYEGLTRITYSRDVYWMRSRRCIGEIYPVVAVSIPGKVYTQNWEKMHYLVSDGQKKTLYVPYFPILESVYPHLEQAKFLDFYAHADIPRATIIYNEESFQIALCFEEHGQQVLKYSNPEENIKITEAKQCFWNLLQF